MLKFRTWYLSFILLLAACGGSDVQRLATAPVATGEQPTAVSPTETVAAAPTTVPSATAPAQPATAATDDSGAETLPTEAPAIAATATEEPSVAVNGRTADGAYFMGREDAPLTIIDYSDFL
jgi:hypothetical protein